MTKVKNLVRKKNNKFVRHFVYFGKKDFAKHNYKNEYCHGILKVAIKSIRKLTKN